MSPKKLIVEKKGIVYTKESTNGASFPLHTHDLKDLLGDTSRSSSNILRLADRLGIDPVREIKGFRGGREFSDSQVLAIVRASGKCQVIDLSGSDSIVIWGPTGTRAILPKQKG